MQKTVISVQHLSKRYQLGLKEKKSDTFAGALLQSVSAPFRNYKRIRKLSQHQVQDESIFWALRDVSFEVKEGEVLGIIGHNGAGKSTLLKILSQITEPTEGEVRIHGRVSSLLEVGTGFHQELSGRENVYMNGTILGMTKKEIDRKFDEIVDFSGVEKHIDTAVKFYSSGMKVRLGFAVAAHLEPEILIIDEVLAVGDAEFQKKCLGKIGDVSKQGRTVLFVSHNMEAVRSLCNRALLLNKGLKEEEGDVNYVLNKYLSKYKIEQLRKSYDLYDSPGNNHLRLISAELLAAENTHITVATEFKIMFKIFAIEEVKSINLSLVLNTLSGVCIFNVGTKVFDLEKNKEYVSMLRIPANLLNNDVYTIELFFVQNTSKVLFKVDEVLTFEVLDIPRSGNWYGKWIGVVRPKLDFTIE